MLRKVTTITPHTDRIWQCATHHSQPLLATASADRTTRIISLRNFQALSTLDGGHKRTIRSVAWKPSTLGESVLATGSFDATAGIWRRWEHNDHPLTASDNPDLDDEWRFEVVLDGHDSEIKSVSWSAGGSLLATCSRDKSVWIWEELDEDNFETIAVLQEHTQDVKCVAWHPEELLLASASYDDTIRLWREDADDWMCCAVLQGHGATVWCVIFEPLEVAKRRGGQPRLASCGDDLNIRIWERVGKSGGSEKTAMPSVIRLQQIEEDWECRQVLPVVHDRSVYSVSWSPRSGRIASCGGDGRIVVYEEKELAEPAEGERNWEAVAKFEGAHGVFEVNNIAWSRRYDKDRKSDDDEILITCGDDGGVGIWEMVD